MCVLSENKNHGEQHIQNSMLLLLNYDSQGLETSNMRMRIKRPPQIGSRRERKTNQKWEKFTVTVVSSFCVGSFIVKRPILDDIYIPPTPKITIFPLSLFPLLLSYQPRNVHKIIHYHLVRCLGCLERRPRMLLHTKRLDGACN